MMFGLRSLVLFAFVTLVAPGVAADVLDRDDVRNFVSRMAEKHGFAREDLDAVFRKVEFSDSVLKAISRPAEVLPWYEYRKIFLQPDRVKQGVLFWREHAEVLKRAARAYGVPPEIIVAIIGVETRYGRNMGQYRVLDSLSTLAFDYSQRSSFFLGELEEYLLLSREQKLDPLSIKGSYAGAMGIPQFIASSFRRYAVDFDVDGKTDIWNDPTDAIGSVANYFHGHGWLKGGLIVLPAEVQTSGGPADPAPGLEPDLRAAELSALGVRPAIPLPAEEKVKLLEFESEFGKEYWLGFWNFYVITRYNRSPLYAMAVYRLAELIRSEYEAAGSAAS